jgi:hypothetical protein
MKKTGAIFITILLTVIAMPYFASASVYDVHVDNSLGVSTLIFDDVAAATGSGGALSAWVLGGNTAAGCGTPFAYQCTAPVSSVLDTPAHQVSSGSSLFTPSWNSINSNTWSGIPSYPFDVTLSLCSNNVANFTLCDLVAEITYTITDAHSINGVINPPDFDGTTHFITLNPQGIVATTTAVGYNLMLNESDYVPNSKVTAHFVQDSAFACQNSGAVYDAVVTCAGPNSPAAPFDIDFNGPLDILFTGLNSTSTPVTFPRGGKWTGTFTIRTPVFFGLFYSDVIASTTSFTVGQLSPMDLVREDITVAQANQASTTRNGIGKVLASTTASLGKACTPFSTTFDLGDCITLTVWPGEQALSEDFLILTQTPPWGYVFRTIDILKNTEATTSMPGISYTFASTSPMAAVGEIHFNPFQLISESSALISEMHSDRDDALNVWQILMPIVRIIIYLVLFMLIVHDLTGIHQEKVDPNKK